MVTSDDDGRNRWVRLDDNGRMGWRCLRTGLTKWDDGGGDEGKTAGYVPTLPVPSGEPVRNAVEKECVVEWPDHTITIPVERIGPIAGVDMPADGVYRFAYMGSRGEAFTARSDQSINVPEVLPTTPVGHHHIHAANSAGWRADPILNPGVTFSRLTLAHPVLDFGHSTRWTLAADARTVRTVSVVLTLATADDAVLRDWGALATPDRMDARHWRRRSCTCQIVVPEFEKRGRVILSVVDEERLPGEE